MSRPLKVGAVMYDPKVSVIWEIIRDFFDAQGAPIAHLTLIAPVALLALIAPLAPVAPLAPFAPVYRFS